VHVLRDLHAQMGLQPVVVDLSALFHQLGVFLRGRTLTFDDRAPLAVLRRSITARDPSPIAVVASADIPSCADRAPRLGPCVSESSSARPRLLQ
jgi:hypothetical protein